MLDSLKERVFAIPELNEWPELAGLFAGDRSAPLPFWRYPLTACAAAGGCDDEAEPAAAAILSLSLGIRLLDDLLDQDPGGLAEHLGPARAANLAAALHAMAFRIVAASTLDPARRDASQRWLAQAALGTALGQDRDLAECADEEADWCLVRAKSSPLIAAAMALGGVGAGCDDATVDALADIGALVGQLVQVEDDLADVLCRPASRDWDRPSNNLALLYAMTAEHPARHRFRALAQEPQLGEEQLAEAQLILTRCGAAAYCIFHVVRLHGEARELVLDVGLLHPEILIGLLDHHLHVVRDMLQPLGLDLPNGLAR